MTTDAQLLEAARTEARPFRELYDRYAQRMYRFHLSRTGATTPRTTSPRRRSRRPGFTQPIPGRGRRVGGTVALRNREERPLAVVPASGVSSERRASGSGCSSGSTASRRTWSLTRRGSTG